MTPEERLAAYRVCQERGHGGADPARIRDLVYREPDGQPPWTRCRFCGTEYRIAHKLVERNAPEEGWR